MRSFYLLADEDVVNLVNLRFLSDYHRIAPEAVMDMRGQGKKFAAIHDDVRKGKSGPHDNNGPTAKASSKKPEKGRARAKTNRISELPLSLISNYAYINPIIALFLGWIILDEKLNLQIRRRGGGDACRCVRSQARCGKAEAFS